MNIAEGILKKTNKSKEQKEKDLEEVTIILTLVVTLFSDLKYFQYCLYLLPPQFVFLLISNFANFAFLQMLLLIFVKLILFTGDKEKTISARQIAGE